MASASYTKPLDLGVPVHSGKVRDIYDFGEYLLLVASDRVSAFDVIMDQLIPNKGKVLTRISEFWFDAISNLVPNHLVSTLTSDFPEVCKPFADQLRGRSMFVRKAKIFPAECICRGFIIGSGWSDYQKTGKVCGIELPPGLRMADQLPQPLFTPSTKAELGQHDENISFQKLIEIVGAHDAIKLQDLSLSLYRRGAEIAEHFGIILADTKFEFGVDYQGRIVLADEVLTPDSSRYWLRKTWEPGKNPPSMDKQFLRDYLAALPGWNKKAPPPPLPDYIIEGVQARYMDLLTRFNLVLND